MPKSSGLRTEILTTISLLMGAALLLGGMLMLRLTEQSLLEQKLHYLRLLTGSIVQSLAVSYDQQRQENPYSEQILKQLPENLNYNRWWLYDSELKEVASFSQKDGQGASPARLQQVAFSRQGREDVDFPPLLLVFVEANREARFIEPIYQRGKLSGMLEIHYSLEDIHQRLLFSQRLVIIYVVLYGAVLVFVGYYLLQRNVIRPARNLLLATEDVGKGNLETRLPVAGPSEIARLASAYNRMVEALRASRNETEAHIDALEKTNQDLSRARDELVRSEKLASVGQLAAGLAHELGNPLAAVIGYLELLKQRLQKEEERDIVERTLTETARIDFLVRELLDFSRPDEQAQTEPLDLVEELNSAVQLLRNQGMLDSIEVRNDLSAPLPLVRLNRNKLQQVFVNILMNAVQACGSDGCIHLSNGHDNETAWVMISDNGEGIAVAELGKIFDAFYTTKEPGQGTGLGLAICQRVVEESGGKIQVTSQLGQGTCFQLTFPIVQKIASITAPA